MQVGLGWPDAQHKLVVLRAVAAGCKQWLSDAAWVAELPYMRAEDLQRLQTSLPPGRAVPAHYSLHVSASSVNPGTRGIHEVSASLSS
jgi:hypothetical protein